MDQSEALIDLIGKVVRISSELHFRTGSAYFVQIQLFPPTPVENSASSVEISDDTRSSLCLSEVFLILSKSHMEIVNRLQVHEMFYFEKIKRVAWQQSLTPTYTSNEHQHDLKYDVDSAPSWYSLTDKSIVHNADHYLVNNVDCHQLMQFTVMDNGLSCCEQLLESFKSPVNSFFIDSSMLLSKSRIYSSFLRPVSMMDRGLLSALEVNIRVKIHKYHNEGWIEIGPPALRLFIYMSHYRRNFDVSSIKEEKVLVFCSVLPIYLWGRLRGFACTIRSTISQPLQPSLSSAQRISASLIVTIQPSTQLQSQQQLSISPDVKSSSYLYSAWKCYQQTKLLAQFYNSNNSIISTLLKLVAELQLSSCPLRSTDHNNNLSVLQLCKLPARAIQHEFACVNHLELFMMRSGHDGDWLNSLLPQITTPGKVSTLFNASSANQSSRMISLDAAKYRSLEFQSLSSYISSIEILPYFESAPFLYNTLFLIGELNSFQLCTVIPGRSICLCKLSNYRATSIDSGNADRHQLNNRPPMSIFILGTEHELQTIFGATGNSTPPRFLVIRDIMLYSENRQSADAQSSGGRQHYLFAHFSSVFCSQEPEDDAGVSGESRNKRLKSLERSTTHPIYLNKVHNADSISGSTTIASRATYSIGVRDILLSFNSESLKTTLTLVGVVQQKEPVLLSVAGAGSRMDSKLKQRSERQIEIILRDCNYIDVISVYISFEMATDIFIGSIVCLQDCAMVPSATNRHLCGHVKHENAIGIVGVVSLKELQHLTDRINHQPSLSPFSNHSSSRYLDLSCHSIDIFRLKIPPKTYLSHLEANRENDRCLWTIMVRIVSIKRFTVSLKCFSCKAGYAESHTSPTGFVCRQCQKYLNLQPYWHVIFNVEDNSTGEATMECEGSTLQAALLELSGRTGDKYSNRLDLEVVINRIESHVRSRGYWKHDSFFISRKASSGACIDYSKLNSFQQQLGEEEEPNYINNQYHRYNQFTTTSLAVPSVAEDMAQLLDLFDFASLYQCIVKIIHVKSSPSTSQTQRKPISKVVKFQEIDYRHPYVKNTAGVSVFWTEPLLLECLQLLKMKDVDVRQRIAEELQQLQKNI